jgi:protein transport protein SEC13
VKALLSFLFFFFSQAPGGKFLCAKLPPFEAVVWRVSWSLSGNVLAVSCGDGKVTLWKEGLDGQWRLLEYIHDQ